MLARRIYIFDFDQTITLRHTGGFAGDKKEIEEDFILKNIKPGFKDLIDTIVEKNYGVYIASLGDEATIRSSDLPNGSRLIKRYMDVLFGYDQNIFKCPVFDEEWNLIENGNIIAKFTYDKKQYHLELILQMEKIDLLDKKNMKKIFFVDDDPNNLENFYENGCQVMNFEDFSNAAEQAKNKNIFKNFPIF